MRSRIVHESIHRDTASFFDSWQAFRAMMDVASVSSHVTPDIARLQRERLTALLVAARKSPLYRSLLARRDAGSMTLTDLPIAHKSDLMDRFDEWVCDPAITLQGVRRFIADPANIGRPFLDRYAIWESSGTSAVPGIFVNDPRAMALYNALDALRRPALQPLRRLVDPFYLGERIAFCGAIDGHYASVVYVERARRFDPSMADRMLAISFLQPRDRTIDALQRFAPTVLATYPSTACALADAQRAGVLRLDLHEVWTGGESLTPSVRHHLEDAFQCPATQSYGASEFFAIASECHLGALHLNSDWVILEPVDRAGQPAAIGESSATVLLTNLANHVQPIIRYDLGDRVRVRDICCGCGSVLPVVEIEGRCDDELRFCAIDGTVVRIGALALTTVLEEGGLYDFLIVQEGPRTICVQCPVPEDGDRALKRLQAFLESQGAHHVRVAYECRATPAPARSGKKRRVIALRPTRKTRSPRPPSMSAAR